MADAGFTHAAGADIPHSATSSTSVMIGTEAISRPLRGLG